MERLGSFHGASVKSGVNWYAEYPDALKDYLYAEELESIVKGFFVRILRENIRIMRKITQEKSEKINPKLNALKIPNEINDEFMADLEALTADIHVSCRKARYPDPDNKSAAVLLHGDFHMWNVAYKGETSFKAFDYQILTFGSSACDIHHFLSQNTSPETRKSHLDDFFEAYLKSFARTLGDPDYIDSELLKSEYRLRSPIGFLMSLAFILPRYVKDDDKFQEVKNESDAGKMVDGLERCLEDTWTLFQLLFDILKEFIDLGTIELMRKWQK